jgi:NitT/TauT family transport system substrate-binding protein
MPFEKAWRVIRRVPAFWTILIICLAWFAVISFAHYKMNFQSTDRTVIRMGYMPVITNLACPLLDFATRDGDGIRFEALKFSSFAEMGEALRNGGIQAAFIIAPLSIVLHQQGVDVRIVYIGNRHESTLVYRHDLKVESFSDLAGKTIAVPMRYSGHNIATRQLGEKFGVTGSKLDIVEMNPPDMASALATGGLDAYFVGEPFAAQTTRTGESDVLYYVRQIWPKFICNLVIVRQEFIDKHPTWVKTLVQGAARSGYWARNNPQEAAKIASQYWNQPVDLVAYAMEYPKNRIVYDEYIPKEKEIKYLAEQMVRFKLSKHADIAGLVDDRFAKAANVDEVTDLKSILGGNE